MKVSVSVRGRFHAFYLAKELQNYGYLNQLITSYPKFETEKYGVNKKNINSVLIHELLPRIYSKLPTKIKRIFDPSFVLSELFDLHVSSNLKLDTDIFVGWSSNSLHSMRKAKRNGAIAIVERGSSHIVFQNNILLEESERFGIKAQLPHPKIIEKELKEYKEADYISIPSNYVKRTFIDQGIPEEKLIHVPYGVNLKNFNPINKEDNIFRVIFCGALSIRKGVPYLIKAFRELNLPNAELWLIGSITNEILPFIKDLPNNIIHKGPFPETELYKYYSQGSVFCLPSIEEGLAMVQAQAMACQLPLICTTNTGGEDLIRDKREGFILPIRDIEKLKETLLYSYENQSLCKEMGQLARERVKSGFTWADYGKRMIVSYQKILNTK